MRKRIIAVICTVALILGLSVTALAAPRVGYGYGCGGTGGGFMWDGDGNFLSREAYEEKLDKAIESDLIYAEDKEAYLEQYDYCAEYGGGSIGVRGGGIGCGRGMGRRW